MSTRRAKPKTDAPVLETVVIDRRIWSVLHNMRNRLTALEMAVGRLNTAAPPKRSRKSSVRPQAD